MLEIFCCADCGTPAYPARRLCPACGAGHWRAVDASQGVIDDLTVMRHRAGAAAQTDVILAAVLTDAGPTVIAALDEVLPRGAPVELDLAADGRLRARTTGRQR